MNIEEARLYLDHTSKEDFNLEEWQKENRYQAIQVVMQEIERLNSQLEEKTYLYNKLSTESKYTIEKLNNIINELEKFIVIESSTLGIIGKDKVLDKLKELKGEH